uniref:Uncharacterized protein n=1 Tax=Candidatus Kentrum sp. MB TaxID=2138164 RepID=A0A451B9F1_9GAMM|nr:MAG: hypothetical protein BECKMB1821G_GA0114241_100926 [Candidatus Kentron sp. MB]VFK27065.1 MAG: hypothetical protein BECKMB1821I_GA0114274_100226 [Candidatus Kentron sp. MB]VFK74918.1 MAG: hypothetical protein BECKMB1821H_GA0114242_101227 [Candidatus Kentron sp. MB]
MNVTTVLGSLISRFEHVLAERAERTIPVPVAVVVTKVDAYGLEDRVGGTTELPRDHRSVSSAARHAASQSRRVRQFLRDCGLGNVINNLESRFQPVRYFSASALGRSFRPDDGTPFAPRGVWAPFLWICFQSGAISSIPTVVSMMGNAWRSFVQSLQGKAGMSSAIVAWTFTLCIAAISFTTLWHFVGFLASSAIIGSAIGIAFLASAIAKGRFSRNTGK